MIGETHTACSVFSVFGGCSILQLRTLRAGHTTNDSYHIHISNQEGEGGGGGDRLRPCRPCISAACDLLITPEPQFMYLKGREKEKSV